MHTFDLSALTTICSTEPYRPLLMAPFGVDIRGERWNVATDGARLLAVHHDFGAVMAPDGFGDSIVRFHDAAVGATQQVHAAALREFFAAHAAPTTGVCETCNGRAPEECEACDGGGEVYCECIDCGDEHAKKCRTCEGTGDIWRCPDCSKGPPIVKVRIGVALFDATRMAPLARAFPDELVRLHQQSAERMTTLMGDGWFAAFMPLRADEMRGVPSLDLPAEPVAA